MNPGCRVAIALAPSAGVGLAVLGACGPKARNARLPGATPAAAAIVIGDGGVPVAEADVPCRTVVDVDVDVDDGGTSVADADVLRGTVVDERNRYPLAGRIVGVGPQRTTTDEDGHFTLARVPAVYDIVVADADRTRATVYLGLRRRDPLLVHKPGDDRRMPARRATLVGRVEGGPFTLDDRASVRFSSAQAAVGIYLGDVQDPVLARLDGPGSGPEFELGVTWDGPETITGEVVAQRTKRDTPAVDAADGSAPERPWNQKPPPPPWKSSWLAVQRVTLQDGHTSTVDLAPVPLPKVHTTVQVRTRADQYPIRVNAHGIVGPWHTTVDAVGPSPGLSTTTLDEIVFDPCVFGGLLCAEASFGSMYSRRCDLVDGTVTLSLHAPPELLRPRVRTALHARTEISWSGAEGALYQVQIRDRDPTTYDPAVDVYTTETTTTWPDLRAAGMAYPRGSAVYTMKIVARGPYATMDEATGPRGAGALYPGEYWSAETPEREIRAVPPQPVGAEEARCQYPYGSAVDCGPLPKGVSEATRAWFSPDAINNKLRWFPELANAIGIHCVRTCQQASAFLRAQAHYAETHPGYDVNSPFDDPDPDPPRPRP